MLYKGAATNSDSATNYVTHCCILLFNKTTAPFNNVVYPLTRLRLIGFIAKSESVCRDTSCSISGITSNSALGFNNNPCLFYLVLKWIDIVDIMG